MTTNEQIDGCYEIECPECQRRILVPAGGAEACPCGATLGTWDSAPGEPVEWEYIRAFRMDGRRYTIVYNGGGGCDDTLLFRGTLRFDSQWWQAIKTFDGFVSHKRMRALMVFA